jgi:hypothetical protein
MADDNLLDFETFLGISRGRWNGEEPSWTLGTLKAKLLWCYPLAMTVDEVRAALGNAAPSGRAMYTEEQPRPFRVWD